MFQFPFGLRNISLWAGKNAHVQSNLDFWIDSNYTDPMIAIWEDSGNRWMDHEKSLIDFAHGRSTKCIWRTSSIYGTSLTQDRLTQISRGKNKKSAYYLIITLLNNVYRNNDWKMMNKIKESPLQDAKLKKIENNAT